MTVIGDMVNKNSGVKIPVTSYVTNSYGEHRVLIDGAAGSYNYLPRADGWSFEALRLTAPEQFALLKVGTRFRLNGSPEITLLKVTEHAYLVPDDVSPNHSVGKVATYLGSNLLHGHDLEVV